MINNETVIMEEAEREILNLKPNVMNEYAFSAAILKSQAVINRNLVVNNTLLEEQNKLLKQLIDK